MPTSRSPALAPERFLLVTGTAFGNHDLRLDPAATRRRRRLGVRVEDVTSARACFGLWGPRARDILAALTRDDVSDAAFPYLTARADHRRLGARPRPPGHLRRRARLGALRPDRVRAPRCGTRSGRPAASTAWSPAGYRAIDALRLEKGYRVWSSDITPDETPFEAGLGFAVRLDKGVDFVGREALVAAKAAGPRKRLRCLVLDDPRSVAWATSRSGSTARSSAG